MRILTPSFKTFFQQFKIGETISEKKSWKKKNLKNKNNIFFTLRNWLYLQIYHFKFEAFLTKIVLFVNYYSTKISHFLYKCVQICFNFMFDVILQKILDGGLGQTYSVWSCTYKKIAYFEFLSIPTKIVAMANYYSKKLEHSPYKCMKICPPSRFDIILQKIFKEDMIQIYNFLSCKYKDIISFKFQSIPTKIVALVNYYSKKLDHFPCKCMKIWTP